MPRYLSSDWFTEANAALDEVRIEPGDHDLAVAYEITGTPEGRVRYRLVTERDRVRLEPGAGDSEAEFSLDYPTAVAIARGDIPAQAAFMQGSLKLTGNTAVVIAAQGALDGLAGALNGLRDRTEY